MLTIFNTLSAQKEIFQPREKNKVSMYVCGVTVYDYCHIGHARTYVAFDVIVRYLRYCGYDVDYVRNITDIDDKIIKRANETSEDINILTERFIQAMNEDFAALNIIKPSAEPRATDTIKEIITIIQQLITKNAAYVTTKGNVYYRVNAFPSYGKLSKQNTEALHAAARVEPQEDKEDVLDFALWKSAKPSEPSWPSPWGAGRPGWHIECSAMAMNLLGPNFDIHGGGSDLRFPHHENEIAQSEAATGETYVRTWMHTGMLQVEKEKMSKSLGNFFTIRDVLAQFDAETVRYFLLSAQYRSMLNYSQDNLQTARAALQRFYIALRDLPTAEPLSNTTYETAFKMAMDDDFNTPEALAVLFDLVRDINRAREENKLAEAAQLAALLKKLGGVFGILQQTPEKFLQGQTTDTSEIEKLIDQRNQARSTKNWTEADRIRQELLTRGIKLEDTPSGTTWRQIL